MGTTIKLYNWITQGVVKKTPASYQVAGGVDFLKINVGKTEITLEVLLPTHASFATNTNFRGVPERELKFPPYSYY